MVGPVGFVGSRALPAGAGQLVARVAGAVARSGRPVAVGCCVGADAAALAALVAADAAARVVVQDRLGHATIGMTLDLYSHVLPGMGRAAAAKLEALLG